MRPSRFLAGAALAVTVASAASACDSSPFAASVDSQLIKQGALNAELRTLANTPGYAAFLSEQSDAVQQQASGGQLPANSLTVTGAGTGTYDSTFVAFVLDNLIIATAVQRALASSHQAPSLAELAAARSAAIVEYGLGTWLAFPASYRETLVQRAADAAVFGRPSGGASQVATLYAQVKQYFFREVCVRVVTVDVPGTAAGTVNFPDSLNEADGVEDQFNDIAPSASGTIAAHSGLGVVTCYNQAELEAQPASLYRQVVGLAVGQAAAPTKVSDGYQVVALTRRDDQRDGPAVSAALLTAELNYSASVAPPVARLLARSQVKVNPLYGKWVNQGGAYQIAPPASASASS